MNELQMFNNTPLPEDIPKSDNWKNFYEMKGSIINMLSEKCFTISQTRYLFACILSQFEREMPVTNHKQ